MNRMKSKLLCTAAVIVFGVASLGFATSASALTMYKAASFLALTLTGVTSGSDYLSSSNGWQGWSVNYENYLIDANAFTSGDGSAAYSSTPGNHGYMSVGDTVTLSNSATGSTGLGIAESYVQTGLDLFARNTSLEKNFTFTFDYYYLIFASVNSTTAVPGDDAFARAEMDILDDFFSIDVLQTVAADLLYGPLVDKYAYSGSFSFMLSPEEINWIAVISSSSGNAVGAAPVPEPASILLFATGLATFGASRLRKKFKKT